MFRKKKGEKKARRAAKAKLKSDAPFRDRKLIDILAISRSGIHAIAEWIIDQYDIPKEYFGNPPLRSLSKQYPGKPRDTRNVKLTLTVWECPLLIRKTYLNEKIKYLNIISSINVLILRDPFNLISSKLASKISDFAIPEWLWETTKDHINEWKKQAKEFLGQTNILPNKMTVNYNQWFQSEEYRRKLSHQLGGSFSDKKLNYVPKMGGGSSFDNRTYQGKAREIKVLERWKNFADNKRLWSLFDEEILELSSAIFGKIEGTTSLCQ